MCCLPFVYSVKIFRSAHIIMYTPDVDSIVNKTCFIHLNKEKYSVRLSAYHEITQDVEIVINYNQSKTREIHVEGYITYLILQLIYGKFFSAFVTSVQSACCHFA